MGWLSPKAKWEEISPLKRGYEAAKLCALNCLAAVKSVLGSLDIVERVVKVNGFVNSAPGFADQAGVINGASYILTEVFGDKGRHARTSVGVAELPMNISVEIDLVLACKPLHGSVKQGSTANQAPEAAA